MDTTPVMINGSWGCGPCAHIQPYTYIRLINSRQWPNDNDILRIRGSSVKYSWNGIKFIYLNTNRLDIQKPRSGWSALHVQIIRNWPNYRLNTRNWFNFRWVNGALPTTNLWSRLVKHLERQSKESGKLPMHLAGKREKLQQFRMKLASWNATCSIKRHIDHYAVCWPSHKMQYSAFFKLPRSLRVSQEPIIYAPPSPIPWPPFLFRATPHYCLHSYGEAAFLPFVVLCAPVIPFLCWLNKNHGPPKIEWFWCSAHEHIRPNMMHT